MTELRTIKCDIPGCDEQYTERYWNDGFPGWGEIRGITDKETGCTVAHLCKKHKKIVLGFLTGDINCDLD